MLHTVHVLFSNRPVQIGSTRLSLSIRILTHGAEINLYLPIVQLWKAQIAQDSLASTTFLFQLSLFWNQGLKKQVIFLKIIIIVSMYAGEELKIKAFSYTAPSLSHIKDCQFMRYWTAPHCVKSQCVESNRAESLCIAIGVNHDNISHQLLHMYV